jgi:predicted  nucleic acid-binding Zn-ribbon protein
MGADLAAHEGGTVITKEWLEEEIRKLTSELLMAQDLLEDAEREFGRAKARRVAAKKQLESIQGVFKGLTADLNAMVGRGKT